MSPPAHYIVIPKDGPGLTPLDLKRLCRHKEPLDARQSAKVLSMQPNEAVFRVADFDLAMADQEGRLVMLCTCPGTDQTACPHQLAVLNYLLLNPELLLFFNEQQRAAYLKNHAFDFGLENDPDPEHYFSISYANDRILVTPKDPGLLPVTSEQLRAMQQALIPPSLPSFLPHEPDGTVRVLVFGAHRYYNSLQTELYDAPATKTGKLKNPLSRVEVRTAIWEMGDATAMKFYLSISRLQESLKEELSQEELMALRHTVTNPLGFPVFEHAKRSDKVKASTLKPIRVNVFDGRVYLKVTGEGPIYRIEGFIEFRNKVYSLKECLIKYQCFVVLEETFYLIDNWQFYRLLLFMKPHGYSLKVHRNGFKEFREQILTPLEGKISVLYEHIPEADTHQLEAGGFSDVPERMLYIEDFGRYVQLFPIMRYGEVEVEIRSQHPIYGKDEKGNEFLVRRNLEAENQFISLLLKQHAQFGEQMENDLFYFYLHKHRFLEEDWFLGVFEEWLNAGITVFGFNDIQGNRLNPHPITVDIKVLSGQNWFNVDHTIRFGKKTARLKKVQAAIRNRSKYVELDDGSFGIIPEKWLEKFRKSFQIGEITEDDLLTIPKINFSSIDELYEPHQLDEPVREELDHFRQTFADFNGIREVEVPASLKGILRKYQHQGLNWLNFLDECKFGGCLADDMGLGKSLQIIAFILHQQTKRPGQNTNLVVVPATLIFNWRMEIEKFAPGLSVLVLKGSDRPKSPDAFHRYQVILISYGTLLHDINFLRRFLFNYIFLDESQQIKNPDSQRYKACQLLRSANRMVITGTPIENNSFDLFSQFSFACPGLLGNKQFFKQLYSDPIDKFHQSRRISDLKNKVSPFILRRTKEQVLEELPPRKETILYCEMKNEQRKLYEAYEKEFRDYLYHLNDDQIRKNSMTVLNGITRLRQLCDSTKLLPGRGASDEGYSSKLDMLMEQVEDHGAYHKVLIFSQFVSMLDLISEELKAREILHVSLTGKTRDRETVVRKFQEDAMIRVFLISLKAGGTGLNLTAADHVYLVDPWWNPAVEKQAVDRAHRIGQANQVNAFRLICPDTVEEKILRLQETKKDLIRDLIGSQQAILSGITREELLHLFDRE